MQDLLQVIADIANSQADAARVIDLRRSYDIRPRQLPTGQWEVIDLDSYEDDPNEAMHLVGIGDSIAEATTDLLEKIAYAAAHPSHYTETVSTSPYEPPTTKRTRFADPDDYND